MKQFTDVACTVCGCVCDDLTITVENNRITRAEKACVLAEPWFLSQNSVRPPLAQIDGKPASVDEALDRAAEILKQARSPLIYGLSRSTTEGQRAAVALADRLGATIDTTATTGHAPSLMALQQVGESTCTLGEVKNRADLVIYWAADPLKSHPRHLERYAADAVGMFTPRGRADRFIVVAANDENETTKQADLFLRIEPDKDWETLWTLRGLLKGIEPALAAGAPFDQLRSLAERMKTCRCGIVFFGAGLTRSRLGHRNVEALLQLVTELNAFTRFYARRMRRLGDVAGADSVLTWQTGYPFAVNFALGYPRYNPGEFSAPDMLARGEIDACLFVGSETTAEFPEAAVRQLRQIPIITLESPGTQLDFPVAVQFTTAVYGVHRPGTAYRMDEVPIPLRVLLETDYPSDGEILNRLLQKVDGAQPASVGARAARRPGEEQPSWPNDQLANEIAKHIDDLALSAFLKRSKEYLQACKGDNEFNSAIAKGLAAVPIRLHDALAAKGYKIVTAGTVLDVPQFQHLANETPTGYPPERSWKNSPGGYDPRSKTAVVAMAFFDPVRNSLRRNPFPDETLREEIGHAVDHLANSASLNNREFRKNYVREAGAIADLDERNLLEYLLDSDVGAAETFAAIFVILHGGFSDGQFESTVKAKFARTMEAVHKVVSRIGA